MERALAEIDLATGSIARGLLRDRRARSLEREIAVTRKRLEGKRAELDVKRQRLRRLEQRAEELEASRRAAKLFRLHSSTAPPRVLRATVRAPREIAERAPDPRDAAGRPSLVVVPRPLLVGRQGLASADVRTIVLEADLDRRQRAEAMAKAREAILGGERVTAAPLPPAAQVVRFAVWCRTEGRCVDCGTSERVAFDRILPARRGRIGRGFEHRAALRALQGAAGRERGASAGHASAGRRGSLLPLADQWAHLGSNQGPLACEASALPLSYAPGAEKGIGGTFRAWLRRRSHRRVSALAAGRAVGSAGRGASSS